MIGVSSERAPHPSVVLPHFVFSAISFLVLAVLMLMSQNELLGVFFQAKILTLVHIAALGWITMVILGALYQLIPVVMLVPLYSEKLAKIGFWILAIGTIGILHSFWVSNFGAELLANASLLMLSITLFTINMILTVKKAKKISIESIITISAIIWFFITGLIGFLMSLNFVHPFISLSHIEFLKLHAHAGMVGWFLLLIIGIGSVLIPMFFLSHQLNKAKLHIAFYSINAGLLFFFIDIFLLKIHLYLIPIILLSIGVIAFITYVFESYKKRARKNLDIGLKHTVVSIIFLFIPLIFSLVISGYIPASSAFWQRSIIFYGLSIILGFISSLILGQYYKTLPFIIWLQKYQKFVGKFKTKLPKDLYSELLLNIQYWSYNLAIAILYIAILFNLKTILLIGTIMLVFTAIIFNINVFKMFFHKIELEEFAKSTK